mgnify:CR=1 FL=1
MRRSAGSSGGRRWAANRRQWRQAAAAAQQAAASQDAQCAPEYTASRLAKSELRIEGAMAQGGLSRPSGRTGNALAGMLVQVDGG